MVRSGQQVGRLSPGHDRCIGAEGRVSTVTEPTVTPGQSAVRSIPAEARADPKAETARFDGIARIEWNYRANRPEAKPGPLPYSPFWSAFTTSSRVSWPF